MSLFKIVQKRTDKSGRAGTHFKNVAAVLLFVFLLPYVVSFLWGHVGEETALISGNVKEEEYIDEKYEIRLRGDWGIRKMNMQEYLIRRLEIIMGNGKDGEPYAPETLKAQAVLLRTQLYLCFQDERGADSEDNVIEIEEDISAYGSEYISEVSQAYEEAVLETDGIYLAYGGQPIKAAYFPVSAGWTREAAQVWESPAYPYLVSVECGRDIMSKEYQSTASFSKDEYINIIRELYGSGETINNKLDNEWNDISFTYDGAGYVVSAQFGGSSSGGEDFRNAFGLNSACFEMSADEEKVVFSVKGKGHGFGMSQYGADEMALSGSDFKEILQYYFFQTELEKIE